MPPDRHVALAMLRNEAAAVDRRVDSPVRKFPAIAPRKRGQIRWALPQYLGHWPVALAVDTVAYRAGIQIFLLSVTPFLCRRSALGQRQKTHRRSKSHWSASNHQSQSRACGARAR